MANVDIPEGRTNDFLVHGVFTVIGGAVLFYFDHWILALLCLPLAVALFLVRSGVEIELERREARVYKDFGRFRIGGWIQLEGYTSILLRYTSEQWARPMPAATTGVRVRTYDLLFQGSGLPEKLFHEFSTYPLARKAVDVMSKAWDLPVQDEVAEKRREAGARAAQRRP